MEKTAKGLLETFNAVCAYTCSDEITLLFPIDETLPDNEQKELMYAGKVQKIVSLSAGLASSLFTLAIREEGYDEVEEAKVWVCCCFDLDS